MARGRHYESCIVNPSLRSGCSMGLYTLFDELHLTVGIYIELDICDLGIGGSCGRPECLAMSQSWRPCRILLQKAMKSLTMPSGFDESFGLANQSLAFKLVHNRYLMNFAVGRAKVKVIYSIYHIGRGYCCIDCAMRWPRQQSPMDVIERRPFLAPLPPSVSAFRS